MKKHEVLAHTLENLVHSVKHETKKFIDKNVKDAEKVLKDYEKGKKLEIVV